MNTLVCPACGGKKDYFVLVCTPCYLNRHLKPEVLAILNREVPSV